MKLVKLSKRQGKDPFPAIRTERKGKSRQCITRSPQKRRQGGWRNGARWTSEQSPRKPSRAEDRTKREKKDVFSEGKRNPQRKPGEKGGAQKGHSFWHAQKLEKGMKGAANDGLWVRDAGELN